MTEKTKEPLWPDCGDRHPGKVVVESTPGGMSCETFRRLCLCEWRPPEPREKQGR